MSPVTVGSIRWRILKVAVEADAEMRRRRVTVGSIRWRILKARRLDGMDVGRVVTVGSIRWRRVGGVPTAYAEITF